MPHDIKEDIIFLSLRFIFYKTKGDIINLYSLFIIIKTYFTYNKYKTRNNKLAKKLALSKINPSILFINMLYSLRTINKNYIIINILALKRNLKKRKWENINKSIKKSVKKEKKK
jgi:hypothetical protein